MIFLGDDMPTRIVLDRHVESLLQQQLATKRFNNVSEALPRGDQAIALTILFEQALSCDFKI